MYQSEETLKTPEYMRRRTDNFLHSLHRNSKDNMDVTDCVRSSGNMEYYKNRLKTYDTYHKQILPDKFELARAGLYYTEKSDLCECLRCHVKLSSWERDDDAIKEHIKWSLNCEYMEMIATRPPRQTSMPSFWWIWDGFW